MSTSQATILNPTRTVDGVQVDSTGSVEWMTFSSSPSQSPTVEYIDSNGNFYMPSSSPISSSSPSYSSKIALDSTTATNSLISSSSGLWNSGIHTDFVTYVSHTTDISSPTESSSSFNSSNSTDGQQQQQDHNASDGLKTHAIILIAALVTVGIIGITLGCCLYRRRRRRLNDLPGGGGGGNRKKDRRRNKKSQFGILDDESKFHEIDIQALPSPSSAGTQPPRFSQRDLNDILVTQRQQSSYNGRSPLTPSSASPFIDPPNSALLSRGNTIRPPSSRSRRTNDAGTSLYTDNSEFDMLAQDGSSYARTISTYSQGSNINSEYSERDLGSYIPTYHNSNNNNNRPRLEIDTKSPGGPSASGTGTGTGTGLSSGDGWNTLFSTINTSSGERTPHLTSPLLSSTSSSTHNPTSGQMRNLISPFSDPSPPPTALTPLSNMAYASQPPISPVSITSTNRSWRTEDEVLLNAQPSRPLRSISTNQRHLERDVTFIHHTDGGSWNNHRRHMERQEGGGEVHLPPSYTEIYGQNR